MAGEPITRDEMIELFGASMPIEAVRLVFESGDDKTFGEIRDELRAMAARISAARDDSDVVEAALRIIAQHGNMMLRRGVEINGVLHPPATYILTHVGGVPE